MNSFDYVVVGAGSAGSVIAARLTEDPHVSVLLVEAGPATGPDLMAVPPAWPALIGSEIDWRFTTVPQTGLGGHALPYPRGKVFGGSSSINAMAFLRGHRDNYDSWGTGWTFDDLLPYFKRSETASGDDLRGSDGPMRVSAPRTVNAISHAYRTAAIEAGLPASDDLNGKVQEGVAWLEMNIVDGRRQSAADGYLRPALDRPNLTVLPNAQVKRLVFENGRCVGVDYGTHETARANREVVLTAGAIGSPQLLMLSGIGPAAHLLEHGIAVRTDLAGVGGNLQDHPLAGITYAARQPLPPAINQHSDLIAMVRTAPGPAAPDMQLLFMDVPYCPPPLEAPEHGYTIAFSLMRPHSRGSVRLASADPSAAPLIDPNFLADPRDLDTMVAGLELARRVGEQNGLGAWRAEEIYPGPADQDLKDFVRRVTGPYFHASGTCRMGDDSSAVVDRELRVRGVDGLRVADASVMPTLVGANPNATVLAIAERAADLISR
jgi:choline dehydrogenase